MWAVWKVDLTVERSAVHLVAYLETLKVVCLVDWMVVMLVVVLVLNLVALLVEWKDD